MSMNESDWAGFGWLLLQAAVALGLLLGIVWWTWRK